MKMIFHYTLWPCNVKISEQPKDEFLHLLVLIFLKDEI